MTTQTAPKRKFSGAINFPEPVKGGETALRRAGIDWTVHTEPIDRPGGERFIQTVRDDTDQLVGVNGRRHVVIQNTALAEWGDAIIQMNAGFKYIGGGGFPDSDKTYLNLAGERTLTFGEKDDIGFNGVLLVNDFNGNSPLIAIAYVGRLGCTNQISGLSRRSRKNGHRIVSVPHVGGTDWKIQAAKDTLRAAVHEMDEVELELQRLLGAAAPSTDLLFKPPADDAATRTVTTYEQKVADYRAELIAPWNAHLSNTALGAAMAAQGNDEHISRSANRDKARVDRLITANFPTMTRVLRALAPV
jgi:hypothetical protein